MDFFLKLGFRISQKHPRSANGQFRVLVRDYSNLLTMPKQTNVAWSVLDCGSSTFSDSSVISIQVAVEGDTEDCSEMMEAWYELVGYSSPAG